MSVTAQKASTHNHTLKDTMCFFNTFGFMQSKTAQHRYCFSAVRKSFRLSFSGVRKIICLGHSEHAQVFAAQDVTSLQISHSGRQMEKSFSPRSNKGTGVQASVPAHRSR